jgi:methyltransferase (TIGR00027 family)
MWAASHTATLVAALRAIAATGKTSLIADPTSLRLLPRSWSRAIELLHRTAAGAALLRLAPEAVSPGRLEHIALRTNVVDAHLRSELERGANQVVLLGAGFDTRGYRLGELEHAILFEVDHPATQRSKRRRAGDLKSVAEEQRFVGVDFEREELVARLVAQGFDASASSAFVWEGVTMYLSLEAIKRTLAALSELAAPGSSLLVSYYDASGASGPPSHATEILAALLGEPFRTRLAPAEAGALLGEFGFRLERDTGRDDWARVHGRAPRGSVQERIAVGRRVGARAGECGSTEFVR